MRVLSILPPEECKRLGQLPQCAILGTFHDEDGRSFSPNPVFMDLLHHVLAAAADHDGMLQSGAAEQQTGSLCIIDLRTPEGPQGRVPPEDVIGCFRVEDGRLAHYSANPRYVPWSAHGMMQLPPSLDRALRRAILETAGATANAQQHTGFWRKVAAKIPVLGRR